jgi:hypothetical protein
VFSVKRKGGVTYGRDEGTLLLLPACMLTVVDELRLLVMALLLVKGVVHNATFLAWWFGVVLP